MTRMTWKTTDEGRNRTAARRHARKHKQGPTLDLDLLAREIGAEVR